MKYWRLRSVPVGVGCLRNGIDIYGGHSQVNPAATQAIQNNYYGQPVPIQKTTAARIVVVLGAGVDTASGFSAPDSLVPKITEWLD